MRLPNCCKWDFLSVDYYKISIMTKENIKNKKIPDKPGVYFFLGTRKEILYIGKATSLQSRVKSYFSNDIVEKRSKLIGDMVQKASTVEWTVTDSVLEVMLLEVNLIRTHKPKFNTISKDDKSYNHLVITDEDFPRVLVVRGKDLTEKFSSKEIRDVFGPFPSPLQFKEALKIIRKLFQFYDTPVPLGQEKSKMARGKLDFNRQIGLYPDVQSKGEYKRTIRHIKLFFEGKKSRVISELEKEMMSLAKDERFEEAERVKRKIFALKHIEDVSLIRDDVRLYRDNSNMRIEAYDVSHMSGENMVGVMVVVDSNIVDKSSYRKFKINTVSKSNDTAALKEMFERRIVHNDWPLPQLIVVDGGVAQKNVVERILKKNDLAIPVVGVVKDEKHNPKRIIGSKKITAEHNDSILLANHESHRFAISYHRRKRKIPRARPSQYGRQ